MDKVETDLEGIGFQIERIAGVNGYGNMLVARSHPHCEETGILILTHADTVHPIGTVEKSLPVRIEGDRMYGPGIYDMKCGLLMAVTALGYLARDRKCRPNKKLPVTVLVSSDEEAGSMTSQSTIEQFARSASYTLVMEPARSGGKIVIGRKGNASIAIRARGIASHSGIAHSKGASAIREIARQLLAIEALTESDDRLTANVGVISGGTGSNVVPAECEILAEIRTWDVDQFNNVIEKLRHLVSVDERVALESRLISKRPPYRLDERGMQLFSKAKEIAQVNGIDLEGVLTGGGSDGNYTAALGVPTLDGMGPDGGGAHTIEEHVRISSILPRTRILAELVNSLRRPPPN